MKKNVFIYLGFYLAVTFITSCFLNAQLPDPNFFYYHSGTTIFNYNTITNATTANTITLPVNAKGLAVNNNFFGATPAITFYTTVGLTYYYYNGSAWVNTGHSIGNMSAVNIGGAGPYIYNWNGVTSQVLRYNGTGPGTFVTTFGLIGPADIIGDGIGNFYALKTNAPPYTLTQYSPTGVVLTTYTLSGFPVGAAGGGFAFVNGKLYASIGINHVWGTLSGTTITYGGPLTLAINPGDYANWPLPVIPLPIELVSFTGLFDKTTRMNYLEWVTATEINNNYFTVEYSKDAIHWEFLSTLEGAGNSNMLQTYGLSHDSPYSITYYRLTQTDYNGYSESFEPIELTRPEVKENELLVYPNPASDAITIETRYDHAYELFITDETGRTVMNTQVNQQKQPIHIEHLATGLYFITIFTNGEKHTVKLMKS